MTIALQVRSYCERRIIFKNLSVKLVPRDLKTVIYITIPVILTSNSNDLAKVLAKVISPRFYGSIVEG